MESECVVCLAYLEAGLRLLNLWACLLVSLGYFTEVNFLPRYSNHIYIIGHNTMQTTVSLTESFFGVNNRWHCRRVRKDIGHWWKMQVTLSFGRMKMDTSPS